MKIVLVLALLLPFALKAQNVDTFSTDKFILENFSYFRDYGFDGKGCIKPPKKIVRHGFKLPVNIMYESRICWKSFRIYDDNNSQNSSDIDSLPIITNYKKRCNPFSNLTFSLKKRRCNIFRYPQYVNEGHVYVLYVLQYLNQNITVLFKVKDDDIVRVCYDLDIT